MDPHRSVEIAFAPNFLIGRELGHGKTATVYLAEDLKHARNVVLKVLRPDVSTAIDRKRFLREISLTARLSHPNILALYDSGEISGYLYYVMPYVTGEALSSRLRREVTIPLPDARNIVGQVASALSHAHSNGCIHRDVKPGNILIDLDHVYLADFGVAAAISSSATDPLTTAGTAVGTPVYMSPEQLAGSDDLDHRTDQYSLACVAYEMLEGHPPHFTGDAQADVLDKLSGRPPGFKVSGRRVPAQTQAAIHRALAARREDRFPDVTEFADAFLHAASQDRLLSLPPPTVVEVQNRYLPSLTALARTLRRFTRPIRRRDVLQVRPEVRGAHLPMATTSFIGRDREIRDLHALLKDPTTALVTVVGEPGVGKSRLALEAAAQLKDRFTDGIFFVPLAPVESTGSVFSEIARGLGLPEARDKDALERIVNFARSKQVLILLDNFEHLIDAAPSVGRIADTSQGAKTLVTSRQRLGIHQETVFELSGLPIESPRRDGQPQDSAAVALFLARAKLVAPAVRDTVDLYQVKRLCQILDGNPLAIELASAWLRVLPVEELVAEIETSLDLLSSRERDAPLRHSSMRVAIENSLQLLNPTERYIFEGLAVFRGSFDHSAAQAILGADIKSLAGMLDTSLLSSLRSGRFALHEMLRQYASERLDSKGSAGFEIHRNHADYYSGLVQDVTQSLTGKEQKKASDLIRTESDNIAEMWHWSCDHHYFEALHRSLDGIWIYYFTFSYEGHGERLLRGAVEALKQSVPSNVILYQRCLIRWAFLLERLQRYEEARAACSEACRLASTHENDREQGLCFEVSGLVSWPDWPTMSEHLALALNAYRLAGDIWSQARTLRRLAWVAEASDRAAAAQYHREALRLSRGISDRIGEATSLGGLAWDALYRLGELYDARRMRAEAVRIREEYGDWASLRPLYGLMWDDIALGDFDAAMSHGNKGLRMSSDLGDENWATSFLLNIAIVAYETDDFATADRLSRQVYESATRTGDTQLAGVATGILAQSAYRQAKEDEAAHLVARARDLWDSADKATSQYHPVTWWTFADEAVSIARRAAVAEGRIMLRQILDATVRNQGFHGSVMCVRRYAEILIDEGNLEEAVELLAFVASYRGTWYESRGRAEKLLDHLRRQMSRKAFARCHRTGSQLPFDKVLQRVSEELGADPIYTE